MQIPPDVLQTLRDASQPAFWQTLADHWRRFQSFQREAVELWRLGEAVEAERAERFAEKRRKLALEMLMRFRQALEQVGLSSGTRQEALYLLNGDLGTLDSEAARSLACKVLAELEHCQPAGERPSSTLQAILRIYGGRRASQHYARLEAVLESDQNVDTKLWSLDRILPIPPTTHSADLAVALKVSRQAVEKSNWWRQKRKGQKAAAQAEYQEWLKKKGKDWDSEE
jgi:hypothetical protein